MTDSIRFASGESSPVKVRFSLTNSMRTPRWGKLLHDEPQVVEVARQPVHAVHHHRVALAREGEQPFQFRTLRVLTRSLVGKEPIDLDMLEFGVSPVIPICQEELYNPGQDVSINPNENSILTNQRLVPDVRLGYGGLSSNGPRL